ncbi:MAG: maltose alpha-D-glucosyltransferase [Verrucomicrobiota bacterium]
MTKHPKGIKVQVGASRPTPPPVLLARHRNREGLDRDPFWYKSGVVYELHVRAFYDANGDGTGDFRGLTEKLDYIKDLGVTAVWLLPFYPSPLKDDGYDIADYYSVHPMYGTLADFRIFLRGAHQRGLRVITELPLNHTSDQHPWFQRSRRAKPGSRWRNFYVWSDDTRKYREASIIFKDVETSNWSWDPVAKSHFWHRFFSHQPDLNYDNPEVHEAIVQVVDFWLDLGVDGLRLDAVPYLYEREGTGCENLPETHAFLKSLRAHVDERYDDRMLLAEANQWPEDAVAYFGQGRGDECHMAFHFPLMPRLFMALRMEDRLPIVDILGQTPAIPETSQWALFLRNHDELALSTVTEEERDYMYKMYAHVHQARLYLGIRRRLAPLLDNDRKSIELLNALLFSLPGTPVLYYGDEIGMGENIYLGDRNGVRTPMQWSSDKNAGFSRANPQSLYLPIILDPAYHYEASNVEVQLANPHSLLWWMRRMLDLRKRWRALGEGKCEFLSSENHKILSYLLRYRGETLLVVANLSRFAQPVELDLSAYKHRVPIELLGRMEFPVITERPYVLSLGPHGFYWFSLEQKSVPAAVGAVPPAAFQPAKLVVEGRDVFADKTQLEGILPDYLKSQRWLAGKGKTIKLVALLEMLRVPLPGGHAILTFAQVEYMQGDVEVYLLPLAMATGSEAKQVRRDFPRFVVAELSLPHEKEGGILYDALGSSAFCKALLALVLHRRRIRGLRGGTEAIRMPVMSRIVDEASPLEVAGRFDQNNFSVFYGDKLILKVFRRLDEGVNPELEIGRFLTQKELPSCPSLAGALQYLAADGTGFTLAVVNRFIHGAMTAWDYTLDALSRYYDRVVARVAQGHAAPSFAIESVKLLDLGSPAAVSEEIGTYLESARVIGVRTAELHLALASEPDDKEFAPEPFTPAYQRGLLQSMRNLAIQNVRLLGKQLRTLPPEILPLARRVAEMEGAIVKRHRELFGHRLTAQRIRIHGDCHLGQVLWTGKDFFFCDFEGDPLAPISERRVKRSPLRDATAMVRSFHYAAYAGLHQHVARGSVPRENVSRFESWVELWNHGVSVAFLKAYVHRLDKSGLLPESETELRAMLEAYLLHQVVGELGRELNNPSDRLRVPLQGILRLLGDLPDSAPSPGKDTL